MYDNFDRPLPYHRFSWFSYRWIRVPHPCFGFPGTVLDSVEDPTRDPKDGESGRGLGVKNTYITFQFCAYHTMNKCDTEEPEKSEDVGDIFEGVGVSPLRTIVSLRAHPPSSDQLAACPIFQRDRPSSWGRP